MTDEFTIPPAPVDAEMLPEPLSFKLREFAARLTFPTTVTYSLSVTVSQWAEEAEALEERVRTGRTKP